MAQNIKIYILNWNGGNHLHDCINSIKKNTSNNYSIVVIDNNSSDSSIQNLPNDIEIISLDDNFGFGVGYNKGISKSITENDDYVILLNYDTIISPDFIELLLKELNERNGEYIYGVKILYHNKNDLIWYAGGNVNLSKGIISHKGIRTFNMSGEESSFTDYVTGCCMIMHKDIFSRLNGFDSRFFMYNEDVDFCLRAKKMNIKCIYLPEIQVFHKVSLSLGGNYSIKKIIKKLKSTFILYNKYYPLYKSLPLFALYLLKSTLGIKHY
tara:strand:+ start:292 stop:1095 length:804 start_codon:yes stop_codon:yes gene_type:complete